MSAAQPKQVLRYPGSKARIASWIVSHFPEHESYLEPFCGSAVVLCAKPRSALETINDLDGRVANLFRVIRDQPEELSRLVEFTPWARSEYELSLQDEGDAVERARRFLVRCWQGFNSSTLDDSGWLKNIRVFTHSVESGRWPTLPDRIGSIASRLRGVQIECRPAMEILAQAKSANVLVYADPPYLTEEQTNRRYACDMEEAEQHEQLLCALQAHPGPVVLSAYHHAFYAERLMGWSKSGMKNCVLNSLVRQEVLWLNPVAAAAASQQRLFAA